MGAVAEERKGVLSGEDPGICGLCVAEAEAEHWPEVGTAKTV